MTLHSTPGHLRNIHFVHLKVGGLDLEGDCGAEGVTAAIEAKVAVVASLAKEVERCLVKICLAPPGAAGETCCSPAAPVSVKRPQ